VPISSPTTADYSEPSALAAAKATVVTNNETDKKRYDGELAARQQWRRADAALKLCILNTVPREIYESVVDLTTPQQLNAIAERFKESGVAEECTIWGNFFGLRAHHCASTSLFTNQFKAGLTKVIAMDCDLTDKCQAYQLILAIKEAYLEYACL
jgi:hypothetical protein